MSDLSEYLATHLAAGTVRAADAARIALHNAAMFLGFGSAEAEAQLTLSDEDAIRNWQAYCATIPALDDDDA